MNNQTQEVLKTMAYVNGKNVAYELPSTYLTPILELVDSYGNVDDVTYKLYKPTVISDKSGGNNRVIAYPRLVIEAPLNIADNEKQMKLAFMYALDKAEPIFKSAIGTELFSCTNLTLIGNESVSSGMSYEIVLQDLTKQLSLARKHYDDFERFREDNEKLILREEQVRELLGKCILFNLRNGDKILSDYIVEGFNNVINNELSSYYQSSNYNKWQLFNATTQEITNKIKTNKYFDRITPTYKLYKLFNTVQ